jgi:hypothetical protein
MNAALHRKYFRQSENESQLFFELYSADEECMGISSAFRTTAGREWGISQMQQLAPVAELEDLSIFVRYFRQG